MEYSQSRVDGIPTYELAENSKNDLDAMMSCCASELKAFRDNRGQLAPAPFYFDRASILLAKEKRWTDAIRVAEEYLAALEEYQNNATPDHAKVWLSPTVEKIRSRLAKHHSKARKENT